MTDIKRKRGRPPGSRNKRSLEFEAYLKANGKMPHERLADILNEKDTPKVMMVKIATDLLPYYLPKLSAASVELDDKRSLAEMTPPELVSFIDSVRRTISDKAA